MNLSSIFLGHILPVTNSSGLSLSSPKAALLIALSFTAVVLLLYLVIDKLPRPKKNKITPKKEANLIKAMIVLGIGGILAASWDAWWHVAVGRDSLWVSPHIFLYSFPTAGIILAFYIWMQNRDIHWKHMMFILLVIPIAATFDNFWHSIFGPENLADPRLLAWSPPHVLLMISALLAFAHLLIGLLKYRKTEDFNFFGNLSLGAISALIMALVLPFHPTELWGQVAGFAGAGVLAFVFVASALATQKVMKGRIDASFMTIFMLMIYIVGYGKEVAPQITVLPHDRPPLWLLMFSYLVAAILLDISKDRFQTWTNGLFAGIVWSSILFGFSGIFFATQFQYGLTEIFIAITFSAIGGLVAASLFSLTHLFDEQHLEKMLEKF